MEISNQMMMFINIGIVGFLVVCIWIGYHKGFLLKLLSILSFFVVGILAWYVSSPLANRIALYPQENAPMKGTVLEPYFYENLNRFVVFIILFVILNILVFCLRPIVKMIGSIPVISICNHVLGAILGAVQAFLLFMILALFLRMPFFDHGAQIANESLLRYSDPIRDVALFYAKEPLQQLQVWSNIMDTNKKLTKQEVEDIRAWLLEQSIDKEKVESFIATLRYE